MQANKTVAAALAKILGDMGLPWPEKVVFEEPKNPLHGDLSTNAAMLLARTAKKPPRALAEEIANRLPEACPDVEKAEAAGPGFCNITMKPDFWRATIPVIEQKGYSFGHSQAGNGKKALVEYVSANPTGPLHVGHGRGAAVGDSVARLLSAAGYDVSTEYYLNDAGRQMRILGESIWLRALQLAGDPRPFPDDCYKGGYIRDLASALLEKRPDFLCLPENEAREICQQYGMEQILDGIKEDLAIFRCGIDNYFSEKSLVDSGAVDRAFRALASAGRTYEKDGALWFNTTSLGDDQDRVLRKSDGSLTYFATDIAYHHDKFARGFQWLIDVWGADHHGYLPRMRAAVEAMGEDPGDFNVLFIQLVNLLNKNNIIAMSTRAGQFVTLADVVKEVGADAARFMFLSRSSDSPLDFDLELAKQRTMDNPVYYVQYGHARVCALLRRAKDQGVIPPIQSDPDILSLLDTPEDLALLRQLAGFEDAVSQAAANLAPHHISRYLLDLAARLHSYYGKHTIINADDPQRTLARLALLRATGQVIANGLAILGVNAPQTM